MENNLILSSMSLEELTRVFKQVVRDELHEAMKGEQMEKFLSPQETCNLFQPKISIPTLKSWEQKGYLKMYRQGARTYYKYSEVVESMKHLGKYKHAPRL